MYKLIKLYLYSPVTERRGAVKKLIQSTRAPPSLIPRCARARAARAAAFRSFARDSHQRAAREIHARFAASFAAWKLAVQPRLRIRPE